MPKCDLSKIRCIYAYKYERHWCEVLFVALRALFVGNVSSLPRSFGTACISLFSVSNKNWTVFEIFVCSRHGLCWWASEHRLRFQLQPQWMLTCIIALCSNFCLVYRMFNSIKLNLWARVSLISSADQTIHAHSSLNDPDGRFCTHFYVSNYRVHIITAHFLVALGNGQHILKHPAKLSKNPFLVMRLDLKKKKAHVRHAYIAIYTKFRLLIDCTNEYFQLH